MFVLGNYYYFCDFMKTRQMRDLHTIALATVSRRDLCYVSETSYLSRPCQVNLQYRGEGDSQKTIPGLFFPQNDFCAIFNWMLAALLIRVTGSMCSFEIKRLLMSADHEMTLKSTQKLDLLKYAHNKSGPMASFTHIGNHSVQTFIWHGTS